MKRNIISYVGNTPLIFLENISKNLHANIYLKLEYLNPWFSVKDRVALNIIETAEREGKLKPGCHVIEATSGNTGVSLAGICAVKGYDITIIMPEFVSDERKLILRMLGANIVLTPADQGLLGPVAKSFELAEQYKSCFIADQTRNPANPEAHIATGKEIWEQLSGEVDIFISASGTGGHLSGIGGFLKGKNKEVKVVAVEPRQAAVLSGNVKVGEANSNHGIIGIGPGFIPKTLNREIIDQVMVIDNKKGYEVTENLIRREGVLVGISTGAVVHAAMEVASNRDNQGKNIVVVAASSTERYLSTTLLEKSRSYVGRLQVVRAKDDYMKMLLTNT